MIFFILIVRQKFKQQLDLNFKNNYYKIQENFMYII